MKSNKSRQRISTIDFAREGKKKVGSPWDFMEDYRSRSIGHGGMEMEVYGSSSRRVQPQQQPNGLRDLRCHSAYFSYSSSSLPKLKERNSGGSVSSRFAGWNCLNDPEMQRKKRVANYKAYGLEGKMKGSFRKSFRWIKDRYNQVVYGYK